MAVIVAPHLMDNPEAIVEVIVDDDGHPAVVESVPIVGEVEEESLSVQEDDVTTVEFVVVDSVVHK